MVDGDVLLLADAVGTVRGLLLYGGIPPGIEVYDVVGTGQVETQSSGLEADRKMLRSPF